ncbi:hypothetical protein [Pseudoalteromonas rhizosphaerae]|uniref:Uncharacterized protein n=1 Tax=Pseudoalteromonas rhizosphaerae TaxID=2518973 RepID=A0ABW8KRY3_9GAMM
MSYENERQLDLSDGEVTTGNVNITQGSDDTVLKFKIREEYVYLIFKLAAFIAAIWLAVCFLKTGLEVSKDSLMHIVHHQAAPKQIVETKTVNKSEKENSEVKKEEPEGMSNKILYSGSIITLVAFILGTGLTLLLTIVKFSFHSRQQNEDNPNIALAGPVSDLFLAMAKYINSKIK